MNFVRDKAVLIRTILLNYIDVLFPLWVHTLLLWRVLVGVGHRTVLAPVLGDDMDRQGNWGHSRGGLDRNSPPPKTAKRMRRALEKV